MKISYKQYAYIRGYKKKHPIQKYLCKQTITHRNEDGRNYYVDNKIRMIWYVLLCIPLNIISLFYDLFMAIKELEWIVTPDAFSDHDCIYAYPTEYPSASNCLLEVLEQQTGGQHE